MTTGEAQKALVHAIWTCIVDASSMNVVMHGAEDFIVVAERARIAEAVRGVDCHCAGSWATGHTSRCPIPAVLAIVDAP